MVKYEVNDGETSLEMNGSLKEITAETVLFISVVYNGIKEKKESAANDYKEVMTKAFAEGLPFMSEEEIEKDIERLKSESKEELVEEFIKALKDFLECD